MRHVIQHLLHLLGAGANAVEKILPLFVELLLIVADQQLAEAVNGENRRFQIVRKNAEQPDQLISADVVFGSRPLVHGVDDDFSRRVEI